MTLTEQILLALKNILRAGTRTVLCILAICIGIASVSIIISLGNTAGSSIQAELDQIGIRGIAVYNKTGEQISDDAIQVMAQSDGISAYMPMALATGSVRLRNQTSAAGILGIDHHLDQVFYLNVLHGHLPTKGQVSTGQKIAVIDEELAKKAYHRSNVVGKNIWISVNGISEKLEICAVISSQSAGLTAIFGGSVPHIVYLPHTTLSTLSSDIVMDKAILIADAHNSAAYLDGLIRQMNRTSGTEYHYENLDHYLSSFQNITHVLTTLIGGVAAISVIVGGLGVMNTMIASIDTRTREIGIYRALGAKRRDIIRTFMIESFFLCLIGGLLGIALNWGLFITIHAIWDITLKLQAGGVLLSIVMASICGICFGWMPAIRAANLDPIQAIRAE